MKMKVAMMVFLVFVSIVVLSEAGCGPNGCCPQGWTIFGDTCYRLFPQRIATHSSAEKKCQEFGGELVSLETKDENDFVENMLNEARDDGILSTGPTSPESTDIWLSATRPNTGSRFTWKTGASLVFSDWHSGQPTATSRGVALCMQTVRNSGSFWAWYVSPCDEDRDNAVVCQKKIVSDKCCQQFCATEDIIEFILMNHTEHTCIYRYNNDTSQHPEPFVVQKGNRIGPKRTTYCDEKLKDDCEAPYFVTWFDVISRCFHQETEGKELMDSSFCQPEPSKGYLKDFDTKVDNLETIVENDAFLTILAEKMWTETPNVFQTFCPGNFSNMIKYLRVVMTKAPQFMAKTTPSGLPQVQMLICYIYSKAGKEFFANTKINKAIVEIEESWGKFLSSNESLSVLNDGQFGWKSKCAKKKLQMDSYKYDPNDKYWGFSSFNAFFSRSLAKGSRKNKCLPDSNCMISYGDTQKLKLRRNLTLTTSIHAKNENYSLLSLFAHNETLANYFVGGSLIQSLFMPFNYHRYHAPVSGKIVFAKVIPGLLYAIYNQSHENPEGHSEKLAYWISHGLYGYIDSMTYISQVATRAVFVIETENHGHVGAIAIGLQSVSSTTIYPKIKPGYQVTQAEELGRFQYGGSTGILLVEDKKFKWIKGTGKHNVYYMMGQKIGEFNGYSGTDQENEILETDTTGPLWGEALGFPIL